jgi:hypothetical protein
MLVRATMKASHSDRIVVVVAMTLATLGGCGEAVDIGPNLHECDWPPDASPGQICGACYGGELRCHESCPIDLSGSCSVGASCGDLSGGSAGGDCLCQCDPSGQWTCSRDFPSSGQECIPH